MNNDHHLTISWWQPGNCVSVNYVKWDISPTEYLSAGIDYVYLQSSNLMTNFYSIYFINKEIFKY